MNKPSAQSTVGNNKQGKKVKIRRMVALRVKNRRCQINIMQAIGHLESGLLKVALVSKLGTEVRCQKVFSQTQPKHGGAA